MSTEHDRILSHLLVLASFEQPVILAAESQKIPGRITEVHEDAVIFCPEANQAPASLNQPVQTDYQVGEHCYSFQSEVIRFDNLRRWHLRLPTQIKTTDRLLTMPRQVIGQLEFFLELFGPWPPTGFRQFTLFSISCYGLRVVFNLNHIDVRLKDQAQARLLLPGAFSPWTSVGEVCGIYPWQSCCHLVGLRYLDLTLARRQELAQLLRNWEEEQKTRLSP